MECVNNGADGFAYHGCAFTACMPCEDMGNKSKNCPAEPLALPARRAWRSRGCSGRRRRTRPSGATWRSARAAWRTPCARSARPSRSARSRTPAFTLRSEHTAPRVISMHRHRSTCRLAARAALHLALCMHLSTRIGCIDAECQKSNQMDLQDNIQCIIRVHAQSRLLLCMGLGSIGLACAAAAHT